MTLEEEIDELIEKENNGVGSIDLFFDYMKTRTCENCQYFGVWGLWDKKIDSNRYCKINRHCSGFDYNGYGCNKFERKDK